MSAITNVWDRTHFTILCGGFSLALSLRFGMVLTTRRLSRTDRLAVVTLSLWSLYLLAQVVDYWTKRVQGPIPNFAYVTATSTLLYSFALCATTYVAILRIVALASPFYSDTWRFRMERYGLIYVIVVGLARVVRTGFVYYNTYSGVAINSLSAITNRMQSVTIFLCFLPAVFMDASSIYLLYQSRAKYVGAAGKEAFRMILHSMIIEVMFLILAIVQSFQEALNTSSASINEFSVADWLFISWVISSWVEQRKLFQSIFGEVSNSGTEQSAVQGNNSQGGNYYGNTPAGYGGGSYELQQSGTVSSKKSIGYAPQQQQFGMQGNPTMGYSAPPTNVYNNPQLSAPVMALGATPSMAMSPQAHGSFAPSVNNYGYAQGQQMGGYAGGQQQQQLQPNPYASNTSYTCACTMSAITNVWDRTHFTILCGGFSLALSLRFGMVLTTRRLSRTDRLAVVTLSLWSLYLLAQVVDYWTKRVQGPIPNFSYVTATSTLCYSFALCATTYVAILRVVALASPFYSDTWRFRMERYGLIYVVVIGLARVVRTGFVYYNTYGGVAIPALSAITNRMQSVTIFLCFLPAVFMDASSIYLLYQSRAKYVGAAGKEAFRMILHSMIIEVMFLILAIVQSFQEALNTSSASINEFADADWLFISWVISSWVEQRKLFQSIFGEVSNSGAEQSAVQGNNNSQGGNYYGNTPAGGYGGGSYELQQSGTVSSKKSLGFAPQQQQQQFGTPLGYNAPPTNVYNNSQLSAPVSSLGGAPVMGINTQPQFGGNYAPSATSGYSYAQSPSSTAYTGSNVGYAGQPASAYAPNAGQQANPYTSNVSRGF
ncbi:hypothetical protein HK405_008239 [Cladochytrium tenue]|nr:hypothetical protein HK405_008239 [Cladochytrium tenue]